MQPGPFHVAFAIPDLGGGGAERVILALARGLIARGHSVDLLLFHDKIVLKEELPPEARLFKLRRDMPLSRFNYLHAARELGARTFFLLRRRHLQHALSIAGYLDREQPDFLLPGLAESKIASLVAMRFANHRPLIVPVMHSNLMNRSRRSRILYRSLLPKSHRIVTVSHGVAETVSVGLGIAPTRLTTIYNPVVSDSLLVKAADPPDHPWFSAPGPPIILAAGRLSRVKDFPTLIHAFEIAVRKRPLRLLILGEGSWRQRLERMVRKKGLTEIVSLPGWVDNPFACMRRAAVFVVSSKYEGLCGVLIEALACGCPCVSTDCPSGSREILDGGRVGPLVPVGDPAALAAAIENMLDAPPDSAVLAAAARRFTCDESILRYEVLLRQLAASSSSRS